MMIEKVTVRNERLWRAGVVFLGLSIALLFVEVAIKRTFLASLNVLIASVFLILANRFRAVKLECDGETLLLVPDYATSTVVLKDHDGKVLVREFLPLFGNKTIETPCETLEIRAIGHRFGKVELIIKVGKEEITLP